MKNIKISHFLIISMLCLGLLPVLATIIISTIVASDSIESQSYAQLESVRDIKGSAVKRHFNNSLSIVKTISSSPTALDASMELKSAFNHYLEESQLEAEIPRLRQELATFYQGEFAQKYREVNKLDVNTDTLLSEISAEAVALQHDYILSNPAPLGSKDELFAAKRAGTYHQKHAEFHGFFRNILQEFGYYDIFLVDPQSGVIFYSVFKELDFGTSLTSGPYFATNFADVFRQTVADRKVHTIDYKRYQPSYEAPASFQAAPIMNGDELAAVLIFQLPIEPINEIMTSRAGLGKTGETYLVGEDRLMRSDSFLQPETHSVQASFANPENGKVDTRAVREAFIGQ